MKAPYKIAFLLIILSLCVRANARIFVVTNTNDTPEITSLRGAFIAANYYGGNNTIILGQPLFFRAHAGQWTYPLTRSVTISGNGINGGQAGELAINNGDLTIIGISSNAVIDAGNLANRIFEVLPRAHLTLENLTITGGKTAIYAPGGQSGGAIWNEGTLEMDNCVLTGNSAGDAFDDIYEPSNYDGGNGGAIYNSGTLKMTRCVITGNTCGVGSAGGDGGSGGGIYNSGNMILETCVISNNLCGTAGGVLLVPQMINPYGAEEAEGIVVINPFGLDGESGGNGGSGGGICNVGAADISFCTINNNGSGDAGNGYLGISGSNAGSGGNGGGIYNSGNLTINTCTIGENFCGNGGNGGAGTIVGDNGGTGGNGGNGGGIYNNGKLEMVSSTIAANLAGAGGNGGDSYSFEGGSISVAGTGGNGGSGGGLFNAPNSTNVIGNTLLDLNSANGGGTGGTTYLYTTLLNLSQGTTAPAGADGFGFDLSGNFVSEGFNLVSTGDGSTGLTNGISANQVGTDAEPVNPLLGPLQNNGGFAPTYALLGGSPAIDQGYSFDIHTDERGYHRPYIFSSIQKPPGGDGSDIGAFELDAR